MSLTPFHKVSLCFFCLASLSSIFRSFTGPFGLHWGLSSWVVGSCLGLAGLCLDCWALLVERGSVIYRFGVVFARRGLAVVVCLFISSSSRSRRAPDSELLVPTGPAPTPTPPSPRSRRPPARRAPLHWRQRRRQHRRRGLLSYAPPLTASVCWWGDGDSEGCVVASGRAEIRQLSLHMPSSLQPNPSSLL